MFFDFLRPKQNLKNIAPGTTETDYRIKYHIMATTSPASHGFSPPVSPTGLLRKGSSQKRELKEKVVQIYEAIFRGEEPSYKNINFWDEFFLLKVNGTYLESELSKMSGEQLVHLKETINLLFSKCIQTLKQTNQIRVLSAMQTLCALIRGIYSKTHMNGYDVINILIGFDAAECEMQSLSNGVNEYLSGDSSATLKSMSLKLLLTIVTATDNISQNTLLEYLMLTNLYDTLIQILSTPSTRQVHGREVVLLLALLVNYRKYESVNPYILKLSILSDELALNGYALVVSAVLADFNWKSYEVTHAGQQGQSWLSSITSMVGSMLVSDERSNTSNTSNSMQQRLRESQYMLLALYEAIHLNRNFITTLTHTTTGSSSPPSPVMEVSHSPAMNTASSAGGVDLNNIQPTNLLVTFLEYMSIILKETKDENMNSHARLCFIVLKCIAEDQYANSLMHDANMNFRVHMHRLVMRHRKGDVDRNPPSRPLACAVLDLMVEFIMSHLMKNLPIELYTSSLAVCHRILCYQKRCRVRLHYTWKELWNALISLLKFLVANETALLTIKLDIFALSIHVMQLFNLFITYGDTFLPSPTSYDELYYELIRCHQTFDSLYLCALRYSRQETSSPVDGAARLLAYLANARAIIHHFNPKMEAWASEHHLSALSEEQVMEVIRSNYDTLNLKLQESLDQFERYIEKPKESAFFTQQVRSVIMQYRADNPLSSFTHLYSIHFL